MSDTFPRSALRQSCYDEAVLARAIGIRFNGAEKMKVEKCCVSEGWIRAMAATSSTATATP